MGPFSLVRDVAFWPIALLAGPMNDWDHQSVELQVMRQLTCLVNYLVRTL